MGDSRNYVFNREGILSSGYKYEMVFFTFTKRKLCLQGKERTIFIFWPRICFYAWPIYLLVSTMCNHRNGWTDFFTSGILKQ